MTLQELNRIGYSFNLKNEVLAIIDLTAIGITRTRQVRSVTNRWHQ